MGIMARMLIRSVMGTNKVLGGGARSIRSFSPDVLPMGGDFSKALGVAPCTFVKNFHTCAFEKRTLRMGVTEVEKLKEMGIGSVEKETVHQAVQSIKVAREDKIFQKATRTWIMAGIVLGGFTFASTLVAEADAGGMETVKEQEEQ